MDDFSWEGQMVTCTDPIETDMHEGGKFEVTRDLGKYVWVKIDGLQRFYLKTRFKDPFKDN